MTRIAATLLAVAIVLGAVGCGGSTSSGVDGSKQVSSLDAADKASVCDWFAAQIGGYNTPDTCDMALLSAPTSQADCLSSFPVCSVTVAGFEACIQTILAAQRTCTSQSISGAQASAECQPIGQAGCFN